MEFSKFKVSLKNAAFPQFTQTKLKSNDKVEAVKMNLQLLMNKPFENQFIQLGQKSLTTERTNQLMTYLSTKVSIENGVSILV